ncbi:dTMP kinase [Chitinophaga tropicalis]|uniref:Thymidylate kinase n=1 Tax=Chitinophaga tropicalis TaxID=2683588 RepID=A0A7K1TY44_9BACT|nr:dTMP kinase [Chitinophaga tropicalis]MVT07034.1 dTMP kinase [Chitinophaga tropicalis]
MYNNSRFIAIEGLDGAGKSTQIELLKEYFHKQGIETRFVHFPRHQDGVFGELVAKFLRGEFGDVKSVHPQLVALLFAEDRKAFAGTINSWQKDGYVVLVDRYVLSNIAFQCAKLHTEAEKKELREWINMFEYEYNQIPKPDLSVYLDVPFSFTEKALTKRLAVAERQYLNGKDDIHEKDFSLQRAVKEEYEVLADTDTSITKIVCYTEDNRMKSIEDIHSVIVQRIESIIK